MKHSHLDLETRAEDPARTHRRQLGSALLLVVAAALALMHAPVVSGADEDDSAMNPVNPAMNPELFGLTQDELMLMDDVGSLPATGTDDGRQYAIVQGYAVAEGDMVLGRVRSDGSLQPRLQRRGLATSRLLDRWPDGIIPYQFAPGLSSVSRDNALAAIAHWNDNTRILMRERTSANAAEFPDYLQFEAGSGCASYVGRYGLEQPIWIADNCAIGNIVHEIGHAIGLFHEHTRPDRDSFIQVNWNNIQSDKTFNFDVLQAGAESVGSYDYGSIMHYGDYYFTANGQPTIAPFSDVAIGQRDALSDGDIASIDTMYATDLALDAVTRDDGTSWSVDVTVNNLGELGANTLSLQADAGQGGNWLSISSGSGWDCLVFDTELRCERDTLAEQAESRFTVELALADAGSAELALALSSRTLDTATGNNTAVRQFVAATDVPDPAPAIDGTDTGTATDTGAPDGTTTGTTGGTTDGATTGGTDAGVDTTGGSTGTTGGTNGTTTTANGGGDTAGTPGLAAAEPSGGGAVLYLPALWLLAGRRRRA